MYMDPNYRLRKGVANFVDIGLLQIGLFFLPGRTE